MNNNLMTTFIGFSSLDFSGRNSLSSFALSTTPLKFVPDLPDSNVFITWDFGDGTISKRFSPTKYYNYPGTYEVRMIAYDCDNNSLISQVIKDIVIIDFLPQTFTVDPNDISDIKCGECFGPIVITSTLPKYQKALDIYYSIENSASENFWNLDEKYSYLVRSNSLLEKVYNYNTSNYIFTEIDKITLPETSIFAKIVDSSLVICDSSDTGAFFVGLSSNKEVYLRDDSVQDGVVLNLFFDKFGNYYKDEYMNSINNLSISLSCNVIENIPDSLTISSNGFDGEGSTNENFKFGGTKFYDVKIPFFIKVKDENNFSIKQYDILPLSSFSITVNYTDGELTCSNFAISSLNYTLSDYDVGGVFRGYIVFKDLDTPLSGVELLVSTTLSSYYLSAKTDKFNVYPERYYDLYKYGEDFNAVETLKDLRFQESLLDKDILFEDFFGSFFGSELAYDELGVKIYEKIKNFTQNTQDIDKCEIDFIESLSELVDFNYENSEKYTCPEEFKRLINIFSIDKFKLLGTSNKFRENFDTRGRVSKDVYGKNLGDEIDMSTYSVSSNVPIIAYEKFSDEYVLLNTYQPVSAVNSHIYALSSYSDDWGWPLVLPIEMNFSEMYKYYTFYSYNDVYSGEILDGVIDTSNPKTVLNNLDFENIDIFEDGSLVDTMLLDSYYRSLDLRDNTAFSSISTYYCNLSL